MSSIQYIPLEEELQGAVERLTCHSAESGYTVARLKATQNRELITYGVKINKQYWDESIGIFTQNLYCLAGDIYGIGFVTADAIAST